MTASTLAALQSVIEAEASETQELVEDGDLEALAWHYVNVVVPAKKMLGNLAGEVQRVLAEYGPWSGGVWQPEGLPVLEVHRGAERKKVQWDELRPLLRRRVLDPEDTGQLPDDAVIEAVDEAFALLYAVAPLTGSTKPRARALKPVLEHYGRTLDEFCETTPGRVSVQIHGGEG